MNLVTKKYLEESLSELHSTATAAEIKTAYESNEDTNAYPDADAALLSLIKGAAKGDLFISNGAASLTKIPVPTAASTLAHTGVASSVPYWKANV